MDTSFHSSTARKVLSTRPNGVLGGKLGTSDRKFVQEAQIRGVFFPWQTGYRLWWSLTVLGAVWTIFVEPYLISFQKTAGTFTGGATVLEILLIGIFAIDIVVNFNLAFYKGERIIFERSLIAQEYFRRMFWVDFVGVFPFEAVALAMAGLHGETSNAALLIGLLRLLRLVRAYRLRAVLEYLQYNNHVSLLWFTLLRNYGVALVVTHVSACAMYLVARLEDFSDDTWLGPAVRDLSPVERYTVSLYWSVTTFTTVGYGDFSPVNAIEQAVGMVVMLLNIVVQSWIIGSITLLIVKGDEKTGDYRDTVKTLKQYSEMHEFDPSLTKHLKTQLRLEFNNREISDEQVLKHFPTALRRKVLRRLYLPSLMKTSLMEGVRPQFVDAFLTACTVEIFSPGEEIVERGAIAMDLFLLVGGIAEVINPEASIAGELADAEVASTHSTASIHGHQIEAGEFVGSIGFFTESPQIDTVACLTVCKTLTMTRSAYKLIAEDHPGSIAKILQNLMNRVDDVAQNIKLPRGLSMLRAGSMFYRSENDIDAPDDVAPSYGATDNDSEKIRKEYFRQKDTITAVQDLVKMHMSKQQDDLTTRFLFAASRDDRLTVDLMCEQGFDPDSADYDNRTGLMVASMKGNTGVVKRILDFNADPNLADVHGSTALYEAVKNGHEQTIDALIARGAKLCMSESLAASVLCQAVFDGDILFLKRLLRAKIQVNAADYDKRAAVHIAAAEGNVAALKVLVEFGADLTVEDRWKNTAEQEARRAKATPVLEFLKQQRAGG